MSPNMYGPSRVLRLRDDALEKPALRMYSSLAQDDPPPFDMELTPFTESWRRDIRGQGGYWTGDLILTEEDMTLDELAAFFYEKLGNHIEEASGARTWEGLIYEMEFTHQGVVRMRSLDMMDNYVWATYVTPDDGTDPEVLETSVASNSQSVARFGRKEELLTMDGHYSAAANAARDTHLETYGWPWARVMGVRKLEDVMGETSLRIFVSGYVYTANWRYQSAGSPNQDELSDWIGLMVQDDCQFITMGKLTRNTVQVWKDTPSPMRVWDVVLDLMEIGDTNKNPYRFHVGNKRIATYEPLDKNPRYFLRGGRLYPSAGSSSAVDPWSAQPAVVRDMTYQFGKAEYNSWFLDARDFYMSGVEVGLGSGLIIKTEAIDSAELFAAQLAAEERIRRGRARKKAERERARKKAEISKEEGL